MGQIRWEGFVLPALELVSSAFRVALRQSARTSLRWQYSCLRICHYQNRLSFASDLSRAFAEPLKIVCSPIPATYFPKAPSKTGIKLMLNIMTAGM